MVMRVRPWPNEISAFRRKDTRELALCAGAYKRQVLLHIARGSCLQNHKRDLTRN